MLRAERRQHGRLRGAIRGGQFNAPALPPIRAAAGVPGNPDEQARVRRQYRQEMRQMLRDHQAPRYNPVLDIIPPYQPRVALDPVLPTVRLHREMTFSVEVSSSNPFISVQS